jgi:hypothetical protein
MICTIWPVALFWELEMKKKPVPETVISSEILEQAKRSLQAENPRSHVRCSVCGSEAAPISAEPLCWVCRRLKISAWRDNDAQLSAQE